jgi:hypothetical protein
MTAEPWEGDEGYDLDADSNFRFELKFTSEGI